MYKHPSAKLHIQRIYQLYLDAGTAGTIGDEGAIKELTPCPPPGIGGRAAWNFQATAKGPIGLLLGRIHGVMGYLNKELVITAYPDIAFDPINCAKQHLKQHIDDLCTYAMSKVVAGTRSLYKNLGTLDKTTYSRTMGKLNADEHAILQRVQVMGHWTDAKQQACYETHHQGVCMHCKSSKGTLMHLWECPALKELRQAMDPDIALMNAQNTPEHLLLGVPAFIKAGEDAWYHEAPPQEHAEFVKINALLSYPPPADYATQQALQKLCHGRPDRDILQLSYQLLKCIGESQRPRIACTNEVAPLLPTAFSDGSLKHPGTTLGLGSYGIWEPGRDYATAQPEEHDFCRPLGLLQAHKTNGVLMAGTLSGVYNSSTRAELAAVIACLPKPGGLHIALDNRSVVDRCNAILSGAFVSRKPWGLLNDGDLWHTFVDSIKIRGAHSVAVTWTKGHSSWQRIASSTSHANTVGNSIADFAAEHGHEAANLSDHRLVLDHHAAKLTSYSKLVARMQKFAARLLMHDRECRKEAGMDTRSKNLVVYLDAPLPMPRQDFLEGDRLYLHPLPPDMHDSHKGLHVFWDCTCWNLSETSRPTTWIELFALYRLWGGVIIRRVPMTGSPDLLR